jgi:O-antigen ligase
MPNTPTEDRDCGSSVSAAALAPGGSDTNERTSVTNVPARLDTGDKALLGLWFGCGVLAVAFPHRITKVVVAIVLGLGYLRASLTHFHLALAGFILFLSFFDTANRGSLVLPGVNLQTVFLIFLLVCAAGSVTDAAGSVTDKVHHSRNPAETPLLGLIAVTVLSAIFVVSTSNVGPLNMFARVKNSAAYPLLMLLAYRRIREPGHKLMIVICVFAAVLANVLFSLREVSITQALNLTFMRHRATALISTQPNLYAGFLSLYLFFFIAFLMYYPAGRKHKLLLFGATGLVVMNLVYTMSRGAWLACLVAAVYVSGAKGRRLLVPVAVLSVFVYFWAPEMATQRWDSSLQGKYDPTLLVQGEEESDADEAAVRIVQWRSFLPMMAQNPMFGVGYGGFDDFFKNGGFFPVAKSAHSSIIEIGVEFGVIGLTLYFWILVATYRAASRVFKTAEQPIDRALGLGLLAATVCLLLLDLSGTRFRSGDIMAFYWILVGITLNARPQPSAPGTQSLPASIR